MSRSFSTYAKLFGKYLELFKSYERVVVLPFILAPHGIYVYSTKCTNEIVVKEKYQFTSNGYTNFMLVDSTGAHKNVNNSIWFWKFDSIEDWARINPGDKLATKEYGFRLGPLGIFPNIVGYKKI